MTSCPADLVPHLPPGLDPGLGLMTWLSRSLCSAVPHCNPLTSRKPRLSSYDASLKRLRATGSCTK